MEKDITKIFDDEDLEILRTIILERSTFYTDKIVDNLSLVLKSENEELYAKHKEDYLYDCKVKDVLDTFRYYLFSIYFEK